MAESACFMQPFSYVSGISIEANQGNPLHALGDSISFGRFVSESLSWEKWSSFSHNRYVEEAAKYSQPGSVAEKKAFFEAHYKSIAARKAAALLEQAKLEQENAAANNTLKPGFEDVVQNIAVHDSQSTNSTSLLVVEQKQLKAPNTEAGFKISDNGSNSSSSMDKLEVNEVEGTDPVTEHRVLVESSTKIEDPAELADTGNHTKVSELEISVKTQMEMPLLKVSNSNREASTLMIKKKSALPSYKPSGYSKASRFPSSPVKPSSTIHPNKEINATPVSIKSTLDSWDKKRSTPMPLHMSINTTPAREYTKLATVAPWKTGSSKIAGAASMTSKECRTPLRTPTVVSRNGAAKNQLATPQSENRRAKTPLHPSTSGSKTTGPKWHFFSKDCSNPLSGCKNKLQSPNLSSPFSFKTEERAARRKEKLEERFNAKEAQRVQLQTKLKEKAETELRKLRQSLCFKARPLPDFYKERGAPKNQMKSPVKHPQSPKLGRKPSPSPVQGTSLPPWRSSIKSTGSKQVLEKNSPTSTHSFTSLTRKITLENTSPNIQH